MRITLLRAMAVFSRIEAAFEQGLTRDNLGLRWWVVGLRWWRWHGVFGVSCEDLSSRLTNRDLEPDWDLETTVDGARARTWQSSWHKGPLPNDQTLFVKHLRFALQARTSENCGLVFLKGFKNIFCSMQAKKCWTSNVLRRGQTVKHFAWQANLKCLTNNVWSFGQGLRASWVRTQRHNTTPRHIQGGIGLGREKRRASPNFTRAH